MKIYIHIIIATIVFFTIGKMNAQLILNCSNDSSGLIPLTDLGTGNYESYAGGLYPGGLNVRPFMHAKNGKKISQRIVPLNNAGEVDWVDGEILFIGMGASVASNAFNTFIDSLNRVSWEGTNACLQVKGLFVGGKDLYDMVDTTVNTYWTDLQERLDERGDTWEKIQLIWIYQQSEVDSLDADFFVNTAVDQYILLFNRMVDSMINLKQVYLSGLHYTGYTHESHKRYENLIEPKGYWSNLAIKEVIERQINGDPALSYTSHPVRAPYISWGPYFWADGINPRGGDSLVWLCNEFRTDSTGGGFHLEAEGRMKEAIMLIKFFETDPVASVWYLANEKWDSCSFIELRDPILTSINETIMIYPNPATREININLPKSIFGAIDYKIYNSCGYLVSSETTLASNSTLGVQTHSLTNGMYVIQIQQGNRRFTGNFAIIK